MTIRTIFADGVVKVEYAGVFYCEAELNAMTDRLGDEIIQGLSPREQMARECQITLMEEALEVLEDAKSPFGH